MENFKAPCGLDCSKCNAYIAKLTNDDELRKKTAEEWSKIHNVNIKAEEINCDGCLSESDCKIEHCFECEIRNCALPKGLDNCQKCSDYKCEIHKRYFG